MERNSPHLEILWLHCPCCGRMGRGRCVPGCRRRRQRTGLDGCVTASSLASGPHGVMLRLSVSWSLVTALEFVCVNLRTSSGTHMASGVGITVPVPGSSVSIFQGIYYSALPFFLSVISQLSFVGSTEMSRSLLCDNFVSFLFKFLNNVSL